MMELLPRKNCSIDGSEIIFFEGLYNRENIPDVKIYYCPVCDVGFIEVGVSKDVKYEIQWHRKNEKLILLETDKEYMALFNTSVWSLQEKQLLERINNHKMCIENKTLPKKFFCRNDGSSATKLKELIIDRERVVFTLCVFCEQGSVYVFNNYYGWIAVASFIYDLKTNSFYLLKKISLNGNNYYKDNWLHLIPSYPW